MIKVGDIKKYINSRGVDFIVKVLNTFEYEGTKYAEVELLEMNGFTSNIKLDKLEELKAPLFVF